LLWRGELSLPIAELLKLDFVADAQHGETSCLQRPQPVRCVSISIVGPP
jgi:hypothetical protein